MFQIVLNCFRIHQNIVQIQKYRLFGEFYTGRSITYIGYLFSIIWSMVSRISLPGLRINRLQKHAKTDETTSRQITTLRLQLQEIMKGKENSTYQLSQLTVF